VVQIHIDSIRGCSPDCLLVSKDTGFRLCRLQKNIYDTLFHHYEILPFPICFHLAICNRRLILERSSCSPSAHDPRGNLLQLCRFCLGACGIHIAVDLKIKLVFGGNSINLLQITTPPLLTHFKRE